MADQTPFRETMRNVKCETLNWQSPLVKVHSNFKPF